MWKMKKGKYLANCLHVTFTLVVFTIFFITACLSVQASNITPPDKGFVMVLQGGFGAWAVIDTYYVGGCFENHPAQYMITVEGDHVILSGTRSGTVPGMGRTFVHTGIAFGFGEVSISCSVFHNGKLLEERTKPGVMIGFFVLA